MFLSSEIDDLSAVTFHQVVVQITEVNACAVHGAWLFLHSYSTCRIVQHETYDEITY